MSAEEKIALASGAGVGPLQPLYFRSGRYTLFGLLHGSADGLKPNLGVVICKPFGYEAQCCHYSVRAFAIAAAGCGVPVMRFDYAGSGDSEELDPSVDQIEQGLQDIAAAAAELRRRTGVERVCLLGFRFGALLAALAAERCGPQTAMIAVAPVVNGRRYVRELRTFELAAAAASAVEITAPTDGSLEVSGFLMHAATIASLTKTDLAAQAAPAVSDLLVIDRADLPVARVWTDRAVAVGIHADYRVLPGFVEMTMRSPHLTVVPQSMVEATCEGLIRLQRETPARAAGADPAPFSADAPLELLLPAEDGRVPRERPVFVSSDPLLFGVVSAPPPGESRRRGIILLNSGGDYHIGPRRLNVALGRRYSGRGYFVLRMDLSGLGDSATRKDRPDNEVFPPRAMDDIAAGVDYLRKQCGVREVTVAGLCSGAYHSFRAGVARLAVDRVLMVNPLNFFWEEGMKVEGLQLTDVMKNPGLHGGKLRSWQTWKKLLTLQVNFGRIFSIYLQRAWMPLEARLRSLGRRIRVHLPRDVGRELDRMEAHGIRPVFVFARGDAGLQLLSIQSGMTEEQLMRRYRIRIIDGADHNFTRTEARLTLERVLGEELLARRDPGTEVASADTTMAVTP